MAQVTLAVFGLCLVAGIAIPSALAWDAWKRYLVALDRTAGLRKLEADMVKRLAVIEHKQAEHARALGARAISAVKRSAEG